MSLLDGIPDGRLGSFKYLRKGQDGPGKPVFEDAARATIDFESFFTDFVYNAETTVDLGANFVIQAANGGGAAAASATKLTPTLALPSHVQGTTGTANSNTTGVTQIESTFLIGGKGLPLIPGQNCDVSFKLEEDVVITQNFSFGIVNALNATPTAPVVTSADTPTVDAAVVDGIILNHDTAAATNRGLQVVTVNNTVVTNTVANIGPIASQGAITGGTAANPAVLTSTANGLANGEVVFIVGTGIAGIDNKRWYIVNVAANTFQISTTDGGAGFDNSGGTAFTTGTWYRAFFKAATEYVVRIITRGNGTGAGSCNAFVFINGGLVATVLAACRQNQLLGVVLRVGNNAGTAKKLTVDYCYMLQERVGAPLF